MYIFLNNKNLNESIVVPFVVQFELSLNGKKKKPFIQILNLCRVNINKTLLACTFVFSTSSVVLIFNLLTSVQL